MELEDIVIEGSHKNFFTPSVNFNAKTGICELSGESFLEDTAEFSLSSIKVCSKSGMEIDRIQVDWIV